MQVEEFLENSARLYPDKTALVCGRERLNYLQIEREANRLAHALVEAGLKRGDRIVIVLPNSIEAVLAIFAALKAGGVFVVLSPTTTAEKLTYVLNNCRASAIVASAGRTAADSPLWTSTPHLRTIVMTGGLQFHRAAAEKTGKRLLAFEEIRNSASELAAPPKQCIDIDLAALVYTSGSTGKPKGVMVTHLNICSAATSIIAYLENTHDDVIMDCLPIAYSYGLDQVFMMFKLGGTVVLHDSIAYPNLVLEEIIREGATGFPLVPTISAKLLQMDLSRYKMPTLRYITNAAAAWPLEHIEKLRMRLPHVKLFSMYGLTECKRVTYLPPDQLDIRPDSVGRGMPNQEVYIVDEQGNRAAPGVVGELVVRGAHVMNGYWEMPEETARCLKPGPIPGQTVLYSGDLFRADKEGYLYFVSRKDDIIKTRGEKVSPREVEDILYRIEGVAEAAVVGVPDPILGSAIKAVLTLKPGAHLTAKDVLRHCATRLEDFMVPKIVEFQSSLPKTESGKINKRLVAALGQTQIAAGA